MKGIDKKMGDEIKYHDRDVILSDAQIEKIINNAEKEAFMNINHTPTALNNRNTTTKYYVAKPKTTDEYTQEYRKYTQEIYQHTLSQWGNTHSIKTVINNILDFFKRK